MIKHTFWSYLQSLFFKCVFKDFVTDFCIGGFSLVTIVLTLESFETLRNSFGYSFGVFFPWRSIDWRFFSFSINNVSYFSLKIFNIMYIKMFLNHGINIFLFGKIKNMTFNSQPVYILHFERTINLKAADDISLFE